MFKLLIHVLLSGLAVFITAKFIPGVSVDGFGTAIIVSLVLGAVNAVLRPILLILTLPINILTLGLFTFVIIGGLVKLTAGMVPGFHIASFGYAMIFAVVLWLVNSFLHSFERN